MTFGRLRRFAGNMFPLRDTNRLWNAIRFPAPHGRDSVVRFTRNTVTFTIRVPYAKKHIEGKTVQFGFGPTNKARLNRRILKPELFAGQKGTITLKGGVRGRRVNVDRIQRERVHYAMKGWAEKTYPVTKKVPKRDWTAGGIDPDVLGRLRRRVDDDITSFLALRSPSRRGGAIRLS